MAFSNRPGKYYVKGWACQTGLNDSIDVHLYVGGPAGTGKAIKSLKANLSSESAVANACSASGLELSL